MPALLSYLRDKHALWYKTFLFIICWLFITWCLPRHENLKYEFFQLKGKPWKYESLIAPFDFPIYKTQEEVNKERNEIIQNARFYFIHNDHTLNERIKSIDTLKAASNSLFYGTAKEILESLLKKGIYEQVDSLNAGKTDQSIFVLQNNIIEEKLLTNFYSLSEADQFVITAVQKSKVKHKDSLITFIENNLAQTILYNEELTKKSLNQELNSILPSKNKIMKGQIVISRGEIVSEEKYKLLNSLEIEQKIHSIGSINYFLLFSGQLIMVGLCLAMMFLYMAFFRKNIFSQNSHVTFLFLLISLFIFITARVHYQDKFSIYIIPFTIAPIIIRAFFDTRTALFAHLNIVLLGSLFTPDHFEFIFIELLGGIAAIFSIANMVQRSQLILTALIVLIVYILSFSGIKLTFELSSGNIQVAEYYPFAAAALMVLISYPMIFLFEKSFGFISDFTLLELSDSNSKLLRELANKAPGTFQHSLQVAGLAEEAIQKIGGNPLLVRTGAMYHDIGKIENPRYFTENQMAGFNPHEGLSYEESAAIIIGHVIKGIEKARLNGLPEQIIDFIRTHHGTSHTGFFYRKALGESENNTVDEKKFTYPGPIPFSKETAVLMMADSVEAASRSLKIYDASSISELVERILHHQIQEDQFVNADITFRDITQIKRIFKKRLMNMYHVRVEYPH